MSEIWERSATEIADEVRAGKLSAQEVLAVHLDRIDRLDSELNSISYLDLDAARQQAADIDAQVAAGSDPGVLAGVPVGVKELVSVAGWPDTEASLVYKDRVAKVTDSEVTRLRTAGAVIAGLTTAAEFGTVSFTNTPLNGITRNPWNLTRTPGGSSGGSAAAVAAGLFPICTGGDGGGSIRIPAAYSGLFGMKSTFGRVGRDPGPFPGSLVPVRGPMARTVLDAARYIDVVAGPTTCDPTSLPALAENYEHEVVSGAAADRLSGARVAFVSSFGFAASEPGPAAQAEEMAAVLIDALKLERVDLEINFPRVGSSWGILSTLDDMAWHSQDVKDHLDELSTVARMQYESFINLRPEIIAKSIRQRQGVLDAVSEVFSKVDILITPTTPKPALLAEGELMGELNGNQTTLFDLSAPFTALFNQTGQPAASIPAGLVDGLPVGVQVVARRHEDLACFAAGAVLEELRPWPQLAPFAYS